MFSGFATYLFGTNSNEAASRMLDDENSTNNLEIRDAEDEWVLVDTQGPSTKAESRDSEGESDEDEEWRVDDLDEEIRIDPGLDRTIYGSMLMPAPTPMLSMRVFDMPTLQVQGGQGFGLLRDPSRFYDPVEQRRSPRIVMEIIDPVRPKTDPRYLVDTPANFICKMTEQRQEEMENMIRVVHRKKPYRRQLTCPTVDVDDRKVTAAKAAKERRQAVEAKAKAFQIQQIQQNKTAQVYQREHEDRRLSKRQLDRYNKMRDMPSQGKQYRRQDFVKQPSGRTNSRNCRC